MDDLRGIAVLSTFISHLKSELFSQAYSNVVDIYVH